MHQKFRVSLKFQTRYRIPQPPLIISL